MESKMKGNDDIIDEMVTEHAIFKIMDNKIIPCSCGLIGKSDRAKKPAHW